MGQSVTEKLIASHLVAGKCLPGEEVGIRIDQTLTQDATGTMAYLEFEAMGVSEVKTELSVSYVDHNTIQLGFENADDHRYLQSVAEKFGIYFSRAGNGICHQVHLERFGRPGKTLIGSDSHTPTAGALGMLAIGAGGLDVALAMAGEPFYFTYPRVARVNLHGFLPPWVTAKDVILYLLKILTTRGNVGWVLEYGGEGVGRLSVPERATIANMGAELGVTTSIFPSDEITEKFLLSQGRKEDWMPLVADAGTIYDRVLDIDLSALEPLAACPHSPDNVKPVREIGLVEVDQVCIGSCTNSSYKDLATVASILKGKKVHPRVSLVIAPGSRQVLSAISRDGYLTYLIEAGARIMESACGFCIGVGQSPPSGGVSLRTSNRNFYGRSGTRDAQVYLVSPEVAAVAALTGKILDPREAGITYPQVMLPDFFPIDDGMIIPPKTPQERERVEIIRGPNIGLPPVNEPLSRDISGIVTIKLGDKITTDHIIPGGERMKYRSNIARYADFVFEVIDSSFSTRAKAIKEKGYANIIVAGLSYGQGSSREHAAICPMYLGVKVVLARSFERIHAANLVNFGILPLTFLNEGDYFRIREGDALNITDIKGRLERSEEIVIENVTQGVSFSVGYTLTEREKNLIIAGGALNARKK
ncbi:MAG: aconitate hydratase [Syntrophales bacterium]|nr:aconitate hydratase [Syntrophales bacterium]